jgi:hypothetical protein
MVKYKHLTEDAMIINRLNQLHDVMIFLGT